MKYAIISDIHANAQAWEVVSSDLDRQQVDRIICLGDVVGYGPRPQEVLNLVREKTPHVILGNHDAVAGGQLSPDAFNERARAIIEWTCDQLDDESKHYLSTLPYVIEHPDGELLCTHAEVTHPESWAYITDEASAAQNFASCKEQVIFFGHSHQPGVFVLDRKGQVARLDPGALQIEKGQRYLVNPGSIGDPRTTDVRASYCIYDSVLKSLLFRQISFDTEAYRQDLVATGLDSKPWFLSYLDGETAHGSVDQAITKPVILTQKPDQSTSRVVLRAPAPGHAAKSPAAMAAAQRKAVAQAKSNYASKKVASPSTGRKPESSGSKAGLLVISLALLLAGGGLFLGMKFLGKDPAPTPATIRTAPSVPSPALRAEPTRVADRQPEPAFEGALRPAGATFVVETGENEPREWWVREEPPGSGWTKTRGPAGGWEVANSPFLGSAVAADVASGTGQNWPGELLHLRKEFELAEIPEDLRLRVKVDDRAEIWINGINAAGISAPTQGHYLNRTIGEASQKGLVAGTNVVAVRATDYGGTGRAFDLGLFLPEGSKVQETKSQDPAPSASVAAVPPPAPAPEAAPPDKKLKLIPILPFPTPENTFHWRYLNKSPGPNWHKVGFDDSSWNTGPGYFAKKNPKKLKGVVSWHSPKIFVRREIRIETMPQALHLDITHKAATDVFLNGKRIYEKKGSNDARSLLLDSKFLGLLKIGANVVTAVSTNTANGEFRVGLSLKFPEGVTHPITQSFPINLARLKNEAGEVVLLRGRGNYHAAADLTLASQAPDARLSAAPVLEVSGGASVKRVLLRFRIDPLVALGASPSGDAILSLAVDQVENMDNQTVYIYLVAPENAGWKHFQNHTGACWNNLEGEREWKGGPGLGARPGEGFSRRPVASTVYKGQKRMEFTIPARFLAPWMEGAAQNPGLLLVVREQASRSISFASGESPTADLRPSLRFPIKGP